MLSRSALPKLSLFSRQISKSVASANKFLAQDAKKVENDQQQETLSAFLDKNEGKHFEKSTSTSNSSFRPLIITNNAAKDHLANNYKRETISNHLSTKNYFDSLNIEDNKSSKTKSKSSEHLKSHQEKPDSKEIFENLKKKIEKNLDKNLIKATQVRISKQYIYYIILSLIYFYYS